MENQWLKNKISIGQGCYEYKCSKNDCKSTRMMHKPHHPEYNSSIYSKFCYYHYNTNISTVLCQS
jgi:hypothetical protein